MALLTLSRRWALLAAALALTPAAAAGQLPEANAKAAFLYNLALFVDWPEPALAREQKLTIGVISADPVLDPLREIRGRSINGRTIDVRQISGSDDARSCHILFIPASAEVESIILLERLRLAPVVTVGEGERFISRGGMLRLFLENARLRFEVDLTQVDRAQLRVSARLLALARVVRTSDGYQE